MKFCLNCDTRLKKPDTGLACPKCGYTVDDATTTKQIQEEKVVEFNVLEKIEVSEDKFETSFDENKFSQENEILKYFPKEFSPRDIQ